MGSAALALILLVACVLRFHALAEIPAGLYCDEASIGYNAYSVLETGKDEHGVAWPLYFKAFGEYKNPVYVYSATATIALFGLTELGTRAPAAIYGVLTVWLAFLVGRELHGRGVGLIASGLLAISPWHIHFSRIGFELIALPFFFGLGLWLSLRALASGRRSLFCLAGAAYGISLYTYATARLFVPLFLLGFAALYLRDLLRNRAGFALMFLWMAGVAAPQLVYTLRHPENMAARWNAITAMRSDASIAENFSVFSEKYRSHFSREFLFERGDPLKRHAVRGVGELYRPYWPWLLLGLAFILLSRRREGFLLLWWLALFPVAASLTQETPTATRTIAAIPVFELIVALAIYSLARMLIAATPGKLRRLVVPGVAALFLLPLAPELALYLDAYFRDYPAYAASGLDGFQHGYRDAVGYMERHRKEYDLLMLTATEVNQPEMLALFYSRRDPAEYQRTGDTGYRVSVPEEHDRYPAQGRILYALRPEDLRYFLDFEPRLHVVAPDGSLSFVVAETGTRRPFFFDWQILGPDRGAEDSSGAASWREFRSPFATLDLRRYFEETLPGRLAGTTGDCAQLSTVVVSPGHLRGELTLYGTVDAATLRWNGVELARRPSPRSEGAAEFDVELQPGSNRLWIHSCRSQDEWKIQVSLLGGDGRPIAGLISEARVPGPGR